MNRFAPIAVCFALLLGACGGSSDPETLPTLELTTTTAEPSTTIEAPTTTSAPTTTTTEPSTSVVAQSFDPETAQAEIAALVKEVDKLWTGPARSANPDDPDIGLVYTSPQRERVIDLFESWAEAETLMEGFSDVRLYLPAILEADTQTAVVGGCSLDGVALLNSDSSVKLPADTQAYEYGFELRYTSDGWRVSESGRAKSATGEDIKCAL